MRTVGYGYDAYGRRYSLTYPNGMVITYGYDNADRMTTLSQGLGYSAASQLKARGARHSAKLETF